MSRRSPLPVLALAMLGAAWSACSKSSDAPTGAAPPAASSSTAPTASSSAPPVPHAVSPEELAIRGSLGVPPDAKTVLVFAQNAHLDIDWQKTFDDYYASWVEAVFLSARQIVDAQPRAFYSVAEMAFLKHHVETHPEELAPLQAAAARGQLHIVGGGMTSPDTVLPETELLLRDFLFGARFAEDTLGTRSRSAWLPDSFGHSATAPDVLASAGFDSVAFSRIDGAPDIFRWIFHPNDSPPLPGSNAERLLMLGSADFVWRGAGGARVLGHFLSAPGLYCMGDNIDYAESIEPPGGHTGSYYGNDPAFTDKQIDRYASVLAPYRKTPYGFVPVGCDFAMPKEKLVEYLDGYNQRRYPTTGVWAVAAPFDLYVSLVNPWRDVLPELAVELNPYFMGFYGTRAEVKRRTRDAARPFFVAEAFATPLGAKGRALVQAAEPALEKLTRADHHDFVTGTSADDVVTKEQLPLLADAEASGRALLADVAKAIARRVPAPKGASSRVLALNASSAQRNEVAEVMLPVTKGLSPMVRARVGDTDVPIEIVGPTKPGAGPTARLALGPIPPWSWQMIDLYVEAAPPPVGDVSLALLDAQGNPASGALVVQVVLQNARVRATWTKSGAFLLTSLVIDGAEAIAHPSFAPHDYHDTGGLWRLGNEMPGCELAPLDTSLGEESVEIVSATPLSARVRFHSPTMDREAALGAGASGLELAAITGAAEGTTRTMGFSLAVSPGAKLTTSQAAGYSAHPAESLYSPTFWPAVEWAKVDGWVILLRQSTGARMSTPGEVELMAARDARSEKCTVEGGTGTDTGVHRLEWRIERAVSPADAARAGQAYNRPIELVLVDTAQDAATDLPGALSLASIDGEAVLSAIKPATRGDGVVVRALLLPGPGTVHLGAAIGGTNFVSVDSAERDGKPLVGTGSGIVLDRGALGAIAGIRVQLVLCAVAPDAWSAQTVDMPRFAPSVLVAVFLVACGHGDSPAPTGGPGTGLSASDSCKAQYSPANGFGYDSDGPYATAPAAGGAPPMPPVAIDLAVTQCTATAGDPAACDRARLMTRDAALCIAKADGLVAGVQPWTATILFHGGYLRIVWNVSATRSGSTPAGSSSGDDMTIDAITGAVLGTGQWTATQ